MAKATYGKAISGNPYKNNGGTVVYGVAGSVVTQTFGRTKLAIRSGSTSVIPPLHEQALNFTGKVLSAGPFAQMRTNKYMIRGVTKELATVANTSIYMTPSNKYTHSINYSENRVTLVTKNNPINYFTGQYINSLGTQRDQFGTDQAAHPTKAVPGHLVIFYGNVTSGSKKPVIKSYPARYL